MEYDLLCVGAGLTTAVVCAKLKHKKKILVVDTRNYVGGNCADYQSGRSFIHRHGPHIFHHPSNDVGAHDFLCDYTDFRPFNYTAYALIDDGGLVKQVPFPYSLETEAVLGRSLSSEEIIDKFFRGYTEKMWGRPWESLPENIKNRVPKRETVSNYFPGHKQHIPVQGYSRMIVRMLSGSDVLLGVPADFWKHQKAEQVLYCGRPDSVYHRPEFCYGENFLGWRSLRFTWAIGEWNEDCHAVNNCLTCGHTRTVWHGAWMDDKNCRIISTETPTDGGRDESPDYPIPDEENLAKYERVKAVVKEKRPDVVLGGRLGGYKYLNMNEAVDRALLLAEELC